MYNKIIFENLKKVCSESDKFFMNIVEYKGHRLAVFDYMLTIPNDFANYYAIESRGSVFEVDENDDYVATVCLPYEKFFNRHELNNPTGNDINEMYRKKFRVNENDLIQGLIDLGHEPLIMEKRDGSIITFFWLNGELDCKSNSSLTSDYKYEAMDIAKSNDFLYKRIHNLCKNDFSVITEYTSRNPTRQIVVPYEEDALIVTGVRDNLSGKYLTYQEILNHFSQKYTVRVFDDVEIDDYESEGIEGYILWFEELGLRIKLKTKWYIDRHRIATALSPKQVWIMYLNEEVDDMVGFVMPQHKEYFDELIKQVDDLFNSIIHYGKELYEKHYSEDRKSFFMSLQAETFDEHWQYVSSLYAKNRYLNSEEEAMLMLVDYLQQRNHMSNLEISKLGTKKLDG